MALALYPELQPGSEILAHSFSDSEPGLKIRVASSELARGGTAVILKGEVVFPKPAVVALKVVMGGQRDNSNGYPERMRREIAAVQQIQHRYILPFLGVVTGGTYTVLVSEFMENGDLLEYLDAKPDADRRLLIIQVARAVYYLHKQAGLVHGDLKCQNVLVSPHGDAQLADFGLSTLIDKSLSTDTTTLGIRQLYTLQFAAPELLADDAKSPSGKTRSKTPQSDVFAFGRLVLQAFTGTVPWPDLPLHTVFHKVLKNTIPERGDEATARGLDDKWWSVCTACWRTKPKDRPAISDIVLELSKPEEPVRPVRSPSGFLAVLFGRRGRPDDMHGPQPPIPAPPSAPALLVSRTPTPPGLVMYEFDLEAPHAHGFVCAHCRRPIAGIRYQCASCPSSPDAYNLCEACETKSYIVHDGTHIFFKLPRPVDRQIKAPFPYVPLLYRKPAGVYPDGSRNDVHPEEYLSTLRHPTTLCDWCVERIEGKWYRCAYCDKDLCSACEAIDVHDDSHVFVVFKSEVDMRSLRNFSDLDNPAPIIPYPIY